MNLISCEKLEKSMVELQFSIDAETFKSAVNAAFKREGKKYAIPGFRKGKAPRHMIEKMYGSRTCSSTTPSTTCSPRTTRLPLRKQTSMLSAAPMPRSFPCLRLTALC